MGEFDTLPGVIPYVEAHTGPRRLMTIELSSGNTLGMHYHRPFVTIDGRQYLVVWGLVAFEIPADRNVHVSVHVEADFVTQTASMILPPGPQDLAFGYDTRYLSGTGRLEPRPAPDRAAFGWRPSA